MNEKLRKRKQRAKAKAKKVKLIEDSRESSNRKIARSQRRSYTENLKTKIANLEFKVKMSQNYSRKLKRKIDSGSSSTQNEVVQPITADEDPLPSTSVLQCVSPAGKKRAMRRLKLTPIKNKKRLDKIKVKELGRPSFLKEKVEMFLEKDENTIVVPDIKKSKKGLRYRLMSLKDLHRKFLVDEGYECSYPQFTRFVPPNIEKPKPEDWGTCLCMMCLNPELKLECLKRALPDICLTLNEIKDNSFDKKIYDEIKNSNKVFEYLEWSKEKGKEKGKVKSTSYHSKKNAVSSSSEEFANKFKDDIDKLSQHVARFRAQYSRVSEIKQIVSNPGNKSQFIRIDWSENAELYQTRQEKSVYYNSKSTSVSVNAAVMYSSEGVRSLGTISDAKSHMAPATWASLSVIFDLIDLQDTETLFIASDSPSSQYRNKSNVFLTKKWAVENQINVNWIYTESGHGKGPMDGVGGAIKSAIKDKIAYNPNSVIRNAEQILSYISEIPKISLGIYTNEDVDIISKQLPHPNNLEIKSNGIGISTVHEISYTKKDDNLINWKKLSSDSKYTIAKIMVKQTSKTKASPKKTQSTITNFFQSKNPKSVKNKLTFDGDKANADIKNVKNQLMITRKENTIVCIFMKTDIGDDY